MKAAISIEEFNQKYTVTTKLLGEGSIGKVYRGHKNTSNQEKVAIKAINNWKSFDFKNRLTNEVKYMYQYASKENIVCIIEYCVDEISMYIVMEEYDYNLERLISHNMITNEQSAIEYYRQICNGLKFLHDDSIIHRDIKPANILIREKPSEKFPFDYEFALGDFSITREAQPGDALSKNIGTASFNAPEKKTPNYTLKADIYSMGVVLFYMVNFMNPFISDKIEEIEHRKLSTVPLEIDNHKFKISKYTLALLEGCLQNDVSQRITPYEFYAYLQIENIRRHHRLIELGEIDSSQQINLSCFKRKSAFAQILSQVKVNIVSFTAMLPIMNSFTEQLKLFKWIYESTGHET